MPSTITNSSSQCLLEEGRFRRKDSNALYEPKASDLCHCLLKGIDKPGFAGKPRCNGT